MKNNFLGQHYAKRSVCCLKFKFKWEFGILCGNYIIYVVF